MLETAVDELIFVDEFDVRGREAKIRLWSLPEATDQPVEAAATTTGETTA